MSTIDSISRPLTNGERCFFFNSSSAHQDLHSFPTRRSSDLGLVHVSGRPHEMAERRPDAAGSRRPQDRKSTRLNSSHVSISYAVFCLKKKKLYPLFTIQVKMNDIKSKNVNSRVNSKLTTHWR